MACSCRSSIAVVCSDMLSAVPAAPSLPPPAPLPVFGPVPAPAGAVRDAVVSDSFFEQLRSPAVVRGRRGQCRLCSLHFGPFFFCQEAVFVLQAIGSPELVFEHAESVPSVCCKKQVRISFRWDGCRASAIKSFDIAIMCGRSGPCR